MFLFQKNKNRSTSLFVKLFIQWCIAACITVVFLSCKKNGRFIKLDASKTNIEFSNTIFESDSINIFDFANVYNGGGVGVGDFDNNGLQDLYFTGNMVANKLYLNRGDFSFRDVTDISQTSGSGAWSRGVAVVDINNDGMLDMYVCATAKHKPQDRVNLLYVNQGLNENQVPVFKNLAVEYGLADTTQSTMAYFFDYDNDSDLDVYIGVNHIIPDEYANTFRKKNLNGEHPSTGKLYRNDWNDSLKHPYYTDVSHQAGILIEGYTHAVNVFDINNDGWQDLLVTNDYISDNVLYINNRDGTFTDKIKDYFKHAAANSMGSDAVDINNDGLDDVIEVDMAPQDNLRKKMFQNAISYQTYQNTERYGYQYQYMRNMLQVNQGSFVGENDSIRHPVFADMGFYAGIAETDWSWTPLVADYDNDGYKDILFTNGFPKDITDHDFIVFRQEAFQLTPKKDMLSEIPQVKIHNYIYKNNGSLQFTDKTYDWGLDIPSFSNGAVYADFDNDGDLDVVINNINDIAGVYENRILKEGTSNFISLVFKGSSSNINGIGAKVVVHEKDKKQTFVNNPYRGYISSVSPVMHFGVGSVIDSVTIVWPGNLTQTIKNVKTGRTIVADIKNSRIFIPPDKQVATDNWFTKVTTKARVNFFHEQRDFIDFNIQKLIPHKFTEYAPAIATGDVNGDGLDDFIVGSSPGKMEMIFIQNGNGSYDQHPLQDENNSSKKETDDRGLLLFDADSDGDEDLYIASGGYSYNAGDSLYADRFFVNNGRGEFTLTENSLPANTTSKFCVRASDYDKDGDLDLFVAGRVDPQFYPRPVSSFIYRNESKEGKAIFTDVTSTVAPSLINIGLTCDAVFSDYDNDGWPDLVLAGEWMPFTILHNEKGRFVNQTSGTSLSNVTGWWNSIAPGDYDNDGDIDYIVGNLGLNTFYKASAGKPVGIYAKDFDDNGSFDAIPTLFLPTGLEHNAPWLEFPANGRDDMVKQMIGIRRTHQDYKSYAKSTIDKVLTPEQIESSLKLKATSFSSAFIQNNGNGKFAIKALPQQAQASALNGMVTGDFDGDGNLDVVINTNDHSADPNVGRYDALNGLVLKGNGKGDFIPLSLLQSGIFIPGNGRSLAAVKSGTTYLLVASQNKGPLQVFQPRHKTRLVPFSADDAFTIITSKTGRRQKIENYFGSSFLSQSSRFFNVPLNATSVVITNNKFQERSVIL
ncbi:MAG: VCBS repeat-containing protein [Bacteroidota bacterium]